MSDKFWSKVDQSAGPDGCWPWLGYVRDDGYGITRVDRVRHRAHRVAYELSGGAIPEGLVIDHLCRNRRCCNPAHLEPVTNKENLMRGVGHTAVNAQKTHCDHGHEFTSENTIMRDGWRVCRACGVEFMRRYRARKRAEAIA